MTYKVTLSDNNPINVKFELIPNTQKLNIIGIGSPIFINGFIGINTTNK